MAFAGLRRMGALLVVLGAACLGGGSAAQMAAAPHAGAPPFSPVPDSVLRAGLWNKPNEACITRCRTFVEKGCFTRLSEKKTTSDPASIQAECDDKFSLCLYKCMCDTCDENQIVIKEQ